MDPAPSSRATLNNMRAAQVVTAQNLCWARGLCQRMRFEPAARLDHGALRGRLLLCWPPEAEVEGCIEVAVR